MKNAFQTIFLLTLILITGNHVSTAMGADNPNAFNRLFIPPKDRDTSIKNDGIHDPATPGLNLLQEPSSAFKPLATSPAGNGVDWVKALNKGQIKPIYDYRDSKKEALPVDMNIVMEVKGSMPNVLFPHKQHTEILECANCHDAIFTPKKGANPMSMADIMLGKKCGICHGSVAFPVTECRRCHSQNKHIKNTK